jgi:hypothetical protein
VRLGSYLNASPGLQKTMDPLHVNARCGVPHIARRRRLRRKNSATNWLHCSVIGTILSHGWSGGGATEALTRSSHERTSTRITTMSPSSLPDIATYIDLIDRFIRGATTAPDFERSFLSLVKSESRVLGEPVFPILEELFEDTDAYVERPELRTSDDDLDDEQLLECAVRTREALRSIGFA